jgi:RimJ/RimL family protein N-acetyltransferase
MQFTTKRLLIRPISITDKNDLFKYRSDPETFKYLSFIPKSVNDIEEFIAKSTKKINVSGTWFQFVILLKESKILIGDIGVHFLDDQPHSQVEIGYTLNPDYRNNGYAREALIEIIDYLFTALEKHRITASIDPANQASINLIEKLGFRKEAHFKQSLFFHGEWLDDMIYAILAKEWAK